MQATGQNLDTMLQILDPSGKVVHVNDDVSASLTDSVVANVRLLSSGTYTIIAHPLRQGFRRYRRRISADFKRVKQRCSDADQQFELATGRY